jgi:hypothetical protein
LGCARARRSRGSREVRRGRSVRPASGTVVASDRCHLTARTGPVEVRWAQIVAPTGRPAGGGRKPRPSPVQPVGLCATGRKSNGASFSGGPMDLAERLRRLIWALIPLPPVLRQPGDGSRLHQAGTRFRPPLSRPGLPPPRPVADAVVGDHHQQRVDITTSSASISAGRSFGRAASIFGANSVTACLAPLKLTSRGSMPVTRS